MLAAVNLLRPFCVIAPLYIVFLFLSSPLKPINTDQRVWTELQLDVLSHCRFYFTDTVGLSGCWCFSQCLKDDTVTLHFFQCVTETDVSRERGRGLSVSVFTQTGQQLIIQSSASGSSISFTAGEQLLTLSKLVFIYQPVENGSVAFHSDFARGHICRDGNSPEEQSAGTRLCF